MPTKVPTPSTELSLATPAAFPTTGVKQPNPDQLIKSDIGQSPLGSLGRNHLGSCYIGSATSPPEGWWPRPSAKDLAGPSGRPGFGGISGTEAALGNVSQEGESFLTPKPGDARGSPAGTQLPAAGRYPSGERALYVGLFKAGNSRPPPSRGESTGGFGFAVSAWGSLDHLLSGSC